MAEPNASVNNTVPEDPVHDELSQFLNERFVRTSEYRDNVKLMDVWSLLKSCPEHFERLGFHTARAMNRGLKRKGLTVTIVHGRRVLRYFKYRFPPVAVLPPTEETPNSVSSVIESLNGNDPTYDGNAILAAMLRDLATVEPSVREAALALRAALRTANEITRELNRMSIGN